MTDKSSRFMIYRENHIGLGIRWRVNWSFPLELSIAFPFFTLFVGIGRRVE
jgi:hypothetical protein